MLTAEVIRDAGGDAKVVLAIVAGVGNTGVDVINLDGVDSPFLLELRGDASAAEEAQRLAIDVELEVDVFLRAADEGFAVGGPAAVIAIGVARAGKVIDDGDILRCAVNLMGEGHRDVAEHAPARRNVHQEGAAEAVHTEATALSGRRIGVEEVVVASDLHPGELGAFAADAHSLPVERPREGQQQNKQNESVKMHRGFSLLLHNQSCRGRVLNRAFGAGDGHGKG